MEDGGIIPGWLLGAPRWGRRREATPDSHAKIGGWLEEFSGTQNTPLHLGGGYRGEEGAQLVPIILHIHPAKVEVVVEEERGEPRFKAVEHSTELLQG